MNKAIETAAEAYIAPKVLSKVKWTWLLYGAAAYFGLRYMSKRGILPKQTNAALDVIDRGIDLAKQRVGLGSSASPVEESIVH